jgi:hypothetical protein
MDDNSSKSKGDKEMLNLYSVQYINDATGTIELTSAIIAAQSENDAIEHALMVADGRKLLSIIEQDQ